MAVYMRDGALLAVEEINQNGGIRGHPLNLLVRNDKGSHQGIEKADLDLIRHGVVAIIGHRNSHDTLLAYPIVTRRGVLLLGAACASSRLTGIDDLFIRTTFINDNLGSKIAGYFKRKGITKILCIVDRSNEAFTLDLFQKLQDHPGLTFYPFFINTKIDSTYPETAKLAIMSSPQAILLITGPAVTAFLAQKLKSSGCTAELFATTWAQTQDLYQYGGTSVLGMKIFTFVRPQSTYLPFRAFIKKVKKMKLTPNIRNALGYEAVKLIGKGLKKAKRPTSKALKNVLVNGNFEGVISPLKLDKFGDPHRPLWVLELRTGGKMATVEALK